MNPDQNHSQEDSDLRVVRTKLVSFPKVSIKSWNTSKGTFIGKIYLNVTCKFWSNGHLLG